VDQVVVVSRARSAFVTPEPIQNQCFSEMPEMTQLEFVEASPAPPDASITSERATSPIFASSMLHFILHVAQEAAET
jgi:hypothetical protein